jgi:hypothetical protein
MEERQRIITILLYARFTRKSFCGLHSAIMKGWEGKKNYICARVITVNIQ